MNIEYAAFQILAATQPPEPPLIKTEEIKTILSLGSKGDVARGEQAEGVRRAAPQAARPDGRNSGSVDIYA